ncbi:hypothetical protein JTE90_009454 [Oedothorax gibbosus]|uniref:C2H2-type domain-containing protein n=1 Tax=Oedothorax gibbosus TaxID=931172 RepID=A0AAV6VSD8_9ARAC|nr:hypothetical protein JTE90_009454 [Oedothorax gibbosus]
MLIKFLGFSVGKYTIATNRSTTPEDNILQIKLHFCPYCVCDNPFKQHFCPYCTYATDKKHNLTSHLRSHTGERPFKCEICGKEFFRKDHLTRHMFLHTPQLRTPNGEQAFKCEICWKDFSRRDNLQRVSEAKHLVATNRLPGSEFNSLGLKLHFCPHCSYSSCYKGNWRKHVRTHTGERPFKCEICGKDFARKDILQRHKMLHMNFMPV